MPPSGLVGLLQTAGGKAAAQRKVLGFTRYLSEFTGAMHLELRSAASPPVILTMEES